MRRQLRFRLPPDRPEAVSDLGPMDRLAVWAFRRWTTACRDNACHHMCLVWNEFVRRFGHQDGRAALSGFVAVMRALEDHARHPLRHRPPDCPGLGGDEIWLVDLIGACRRGDAPRSRGLAEWNVSADGIDAVLEAAGAMAAVMRDHAGRSHRRRPTTPLGRGRTAG